VGIAVKYILIGSLVLLFTVAGIWYWSMVSNVDQAKTIVETSGSMGELIKRVKKDDEGFYVIDFTAAKGDSIQRFKEFLQLDAKTVRIVVGKESD
jgi:ribosomal protein S6